MLQVYDRVIPSRNVATLLGLSAIVVIAYLLQGYFDALRGRMLARIGALFDAELQPQIYFALVSLPLRGTKPILGQQPLRDLDQVRAFLSGPGPTAFLDMPWIPLFLILLFLFHPAIGVVATCGAGAIIAVTLLTEWQSRSAAKVSTEGNAQRQVLADALRQNADVIRALGMTGRLADTVVAGKRALHSSQHAASRRPCESWCRGQGLAVHPAIGGAWGWRLSGGGGAGVRWHHDCVCDRDGPRTWHRSRSRYRTGSNSLRHARGLAACAPSSRLPHAPAAPAVILQRPQRSLKVEDLSVVVPGTQKTVISHVSFDLRRERGLALLGASAAGKSSLAKALVESGRPRRARYASTARQSIAGVPTTSGGTSVIFRRMYPCSTGQSRRTSRVSMKRRHRRPFWKLRACPALTR